MHNRPSWHAEQALHQLTTDPLRVSWLSERGSLTARLRATWGDVSVDVIGEGLAMPLPHEASRLAMPEADMAWVRCVWLRCHGQARVYARTVIPHWGALNPWAQVQRLGRQPLGELLFRATDVERSAFEWCADANWPSTGDAAPASAPVLARRCLFGRRGAALLLTEVFWDVQSGAPPM